MMCAQIKLPYAIPTLPQARQRLREAKQEVRHRAEMLASLKSDLKSAQAVLVSAAAVLEERERVLLDAAENSDDATIANGDHGKVWCEYLKTESRIESLRGTVRDADVRLIEALHHLRAAREDMQAAREGRKSR